MVCHKSYGVSDGAIGCRMNLHETISGKYTIEFFLQREILFIIKFR